MTWRWVMIIILSLAAAAAAVVMVVIMMLVMMLNNWLYGKAAAGRARARAKRKTKNKKTSRRKILKKKNTHTLGPEAARGPLHRAHERASESRISSARGPART
ncbi:hypothetical protein ElyMa_003773100 [Elysia marginata]|uniref:Uncharacterized protein n=1 Tax=Elysia marginata TaxID=1093978 RepID=A0AAV4FAC8_9GAST|nr:hypothetical protein ElyMa_003773100 [Elysia marginata]